MTWRCCASIENPEPHIPARGVQVGYCRHTEHHCGGRLDEFEDCGNPGPSETLKTSSQISGVGRTYHYEEKLSNSGQGVPMPCM